MNGTHWPVADLIATGIVDLRAGLATNESLLLSLAAPRLRDVGHTIGDRAEPRSQAGYRKRPHFTWIAAARRGVWLT